MKKYPHLRSWLAAVTSLAVITAVVIIGLCNARAPSRDRAGSENAGQWLLFGGTVHRNMVNSVEKNMPTDWSAQEGQEKNIKWSADLGSKAYGGPVIAHGRIFVGTNNEKPRNPKTKGDKGILMCFRESDGKFLWQHVHDKLPAGRVNDWPLEGICSTPVIDGNRLYYVTNRCELISSDLDGKILWRLDMIKKYDVFPHNLATCSPLVVGDLVFLETSNGVDEGHKEIPQPKAPSFLAVDKKTGNVVWHDNTPSARLVALQKAGIEVSTKDLIDKGEVIMHGQWSNPAFAVVKGKPQVIFPGGDGWLYAFEPTKGTPIWRFDANPKNSIYKLGGQGTRSDFLASPVVYDNKLYIGVGQDPEHKVGVGHFWCIDITKTGDISGELVESYKGKKTEANPLGVISKKNPNSGVVWHFGGPANKAKVGRNYYFARTMSTCAIHDGLVYESDLAGYVFCFDAKTGKKYWEHNMQAQTWCSPYWVDGKIYMGNDDGMLHIFADGKQKKLLKTIEMEGNLRATPVAANGVLYVMTENKLYAIKK
jgi:outer membrane protein assembly factor BamB